MHWRHWKRLGENTVAQRLRDLRRLGAHPVMPVKLHGSRYELVDSFYNHMRYREEVEQKAPTAVRNDFKAAIALGDFLQVPREVWPRTPTVPRRARMKLPSPDLIRSLLQADFVPNPKSSYEQALVGYLLVLDFGFGLRFPNEAFALKLGDFNPEDHTIVVREPKKGGSTRRLLIEPQWLCCSKRHASLAQYLKWRAKVDVGGTDAFFLKPDGQPFKSKEALKVFLDRRVKPKFPWFHLYLGRKWCANARLIDWGFDYARVADWLGHESVDMTRRQYEHDARLHNKMYGGAWLLRAFQKPPVRAKAEADSRRPVFGESPGVSPVSVDAPAGIQTAPLLLAPIDRTRFFALSIFRPEPAGPGEPGSLFPRLFYHVHGRCKPVDAVDVRIVRAMGIVPYGPVPQGPGRMKPAALARAVGTSVNTVKARIAAMEKAGVLAGYQLVPNLRHLGLAAEAYRFRVDDETRKDAAVAAIQGVQGILELHDFIGPHLCADIAYRDETDRAEKLRTLVEITKGDSEPPRFYGRAMPSVDRKLDALDWRIIQALRWRAMQPLSEVAKGIGVSHWTVKRRHDRMARDGDFFKIPLLDPSKAEGLVPFELLLFLKAGTQKDILGAVLREFNSHAVYANVPSSPRLGHFFVVLFARSTAEVDELVARARALRGVERVEPMFFRGLFDRSQWLDELIDARAKAGMP